MSRIVPLTTVLLCLCVPAIADTVTVSQLLHYPDNNNNGEANGPWFLPPDWTLDWSPYCRGGQEDWGWTHDMISHNLVPANAIGIASATLKIRDWSAYNVAETQTDTIYAIRSSGGTQTAFRPSSATDESHMIPNPALWLPATALGTLTATEAQVWGNFSISALPAGVLNELFSNGALSVFMNIDNWQGGRVSIAYSMLTVDYVVPSATWEPNMPVYRFWSPKAGQHFYTTSESEKNKLQTKYTPDVWTYETVAFHTYPEKRQNGSGTNPVVSPVFRFWCQSTGEHFFTVKETEQDKLLAYVDNERGLRHPDEGNGLVGYPSTYTFEGIAFYAIPAGVSSPPSGSLPVYRFYSPKTGEHFYTIDEAEKNRIIAKYPSSVWTYEEIAFYAYP